MSSGGVAQKGFVPLVCDKLVLARAQEMDEKYRLLARGFCFSQSDQCANIMNI